MPTLFVCHCIDTEGPLWETDTAREELIAAALGLPEKLSLAQLRRLTEDNTAGLSEVQLGLLKQLLSERIAKFNRHWGEVEAMLNDALSQEFRKRFKDSTGAPWIYNWFVMDHVDYVVNPRHRDIGYHNIYDRYVSMLSQHGPHHDEIHWHYHPMSFAHEAHRYATSLLRSPHVVESLTRKVIDRCTFPVAYRAGFHTERPDNHWFMEQWVPFDFSNQAMHAERCASINADIEGGRFGDWRRAPVSWRPYHPKHDDYQSPGACRRLIFRCLNVGTRLRLLTKEDVRDAFNEAQAHGSAVLAFTNHDYRDIRPDIEEVWQLVMEVAGEFPDVEWKHSGALAAAQEFVEPEFNCSIDLNAEFLSSGQKTVLSVEVTSPIFGPQPFLAVKTWGGTYVHENFDEQSHGSKWSYTFDEHSIPFRVVGVVGVAASNRYGRSAVKTFDHEGRLRSSALS